MCGIYQIRGDDDDDDDDADDFLSRFGLMVVTVFLFGTWVACAVIAGLCIAEGNIEIGHGLMISSIILALVLIAWLDRGSWCCRKCIKRDRNFDPYFVPRVPKAVQKSSAKVKVDKREKRRERENCKKRLIQWQSGPDSRIRMTFEGKPTWIQQGKDNKKWHANWLGHSVTFREQDLPPNVTKWGFM